MPLLPRLFHLALKVVARDDVPRPSTLSLLALSPPLSQHQGLAIKRYHLLSLTIDFSFQSRQRQLGRVRQDGFRVRGLLPLPDLAFLSLTAGVRAFR